MKIVFMGTPEFAVETLNRIHNNCNHQIVAIVTVPDKPAGRGQQIKKSPVKLYATAHNIPVLQPDKLSDTSFINELTSLNADVFVVVAFRMLPEAVWKIPTQGTFNLHASLLPNYRGAAPINWAIINGESKTGVTTFFIDHKIDTGNIILQQSIDIQETDNAGIVHDKLMSIGAELVIETLSLIASNTVTTTTQPKDYTPQYAPKIQKEDCVINWNNTAKSVYNFIRGLSPYPTAWTFLCENKELSFKIYNTLYTTEPHNIKPGTIICNKNELRVATTDGFITINEIQMTGKKKMKTEDLLNGYKFNENDCFHTITDK